MPALSQRLARLAFAGMLGWLALLFLPLATAPGPAEEAGHLLLLAPLVLVPLYLTASVPASFEPAPRSLDVASWLLLPGMLGAAGSLLVPVGLVAGLLAAPWLLAAAAVAVWSVRRGLRLWREGALDAAEAALVLGWATLPGGALWLVLARSGAPTDYTGLIVLLTAVHFHYAGCLVLVWAGLLGRTLPASLRGLHRVLGVGLAVGFWGVAAGIALIRGPAGGSTVETVAVVVLAASAIGAGGLGLVRAGRIEDRMAGLMIAVSGGVLILAMGFALWFHLGARVGADAPDVAQMVSRHGWLNAFFGLWGALGWRRLRPRPAAAVR
ncbi:YndJ family transporter [Rubrivirga marina]|uniref:YndJ-like protein n=1 Tax=Rubrivirga marina TaxID=1196024 RepID=A0A271IVH6_9BACT|nr:YndJ family transporter [Rubrivirga marina]PAP75202.1 hypothetical protein BSZ37_01460 [Rubrivirga marina]